MRGCGSLKRLSLNRTRGLSELPLLNYLTSLPSFDWVLLNEQPLTDEGLERIVSRFPSLRKLSIGSCSQLTPRIIEISRNGIPPPDVFPSVPVVLPSPLTFKASRLAWLDLSGSQFLSLDLLKQIVTQCQELRSINVVQTSLTETEVLALSWTISHPVLGLIRGPKGPFLFLLLGSPTLFRPKPGHSL